jgi:hypothetical protein|tara:strand:+ start:149 stop:391 length:243 start_codon:yes stop_codon:yes gene_type:complete
MSITFKSPDEKWQLNIRNSAGMTTEWFEPRWTKIHLKADYKDPADVIKAIEKEKQADSDKSESKYTTKEIIEAMDRINAR